MPASPTPTPSPADAAVVTRAREVVSVLCDDLRASLLPRSGARQAREKRDGTPVTDADVETDRRISDALTAAFPDHAIVSEEATTRWEGREWTWVVDPIDGTSNFDAGIPYWSVSIALLHHGMPVYGCIEAPPLHSRFEAARGQGATRDGTPLRVRDPVDFRSGHNSHVPIAVSAATIRRASRVVRLNARVLGSSALDLAMVAAGSVVAAHQRRPKIWDVAAGLLLVEEAGGAYLWLDGPRLPVPAGIELDGHAMPVAAGPDGAWLQALVTAM